MSTFTLSFWFRKVPGVIVQLPVLWFLLVAHVLFPEQVVAVVIIIGDSHVEGTTRVLVLVHRHLDVDRADLRVGDGGGCVFESFAHPLAMVLLCLAPLHLLHIGSSIHRHFAVMRATEDQVTHLPGKPFDDRMKSNLSHIVVLTFVIMKFVPGGPPLDYRYCFDGGSLLLRYSWLNPVLGWLFFKLKLPKRFAKYLSPTAVGCFGISSRPSVAEDGE